MLHAPKRFRAEPVFDLQQFELADCCGRPPGCFSLLNQLVMHGRMWCYRYTSAKPTITHNLPSRSRKRHGVVAGEFGRGIVEKHT